MSTTLYYASDVHGSEILWRKFLGAAKYYDAEVLVMGGDIAGKGVVPVVDDDAGYRVEQITGDRLLRESELPEVERRVRDLGLYPYRIRREELEGMYADERAVGDVFAKVMRDTLADWLRLAEERLAGRGIRLYVMIGNDDDESLREVIAASPIAVDPEDQVIEIGEGFRMFSCGWANPTPWHTPREMPEDLLEQHLEAHLTDLEDPSRAIFNFHAPPYGSGLDQAPVLDATLKPVVSGGAVTVAAVGSKAVRAVIERHQPALGLHGHIHESRGIARIGRSICINTGSAYSEGVLHGAIVTLDARKGVKRHILATG